MRDSYFLSRKNLFSIPHNTLYFSGHSLGPMSYASQQALIQAQSEWAHQLVSGWTASNWIELPQKLGNKIAPLIGTNLHDVIVCDSTTVNLYKSLLMALSIQKNRSIILSTRDNFPTDLYVLQSLKKFKENIQIKKVNEDEILSSIDENIAVVLLTQVNYRSSKKLDMKTITEKAHASGALVIWDLSHSVGALSLDCAALNIDFAVGCTYKYLNGGPGAPGFIYVNPKHQEIAPSLVGWIGHQTPFAFSPKYKAAKGVQAQLLGTPSILSMQALLGALTVFGSIDMTTLHRKSQDLSDYFIEALATTAPTLICLSPKDRDLRGNHIGLMHPKAELIAQALIANKIVIDYRPPNLIRFGINALYLDFEEIEQAIEKIKLIMRSI